MKPILWAIALIGALVRGWYVGTNIGTNIGVVATSSAVAVDVVGSKVGTSTTGVAFTLGGGTSTYPILIKDSYDTATFTIIPTSVTAANSPFIRFNILGSYDRGCDTATSSTVLSNQIVTGDINWVDAGTLLKDLAGSATLNTGTTTFYYTPDKAKVGRSVTLKDVDFRCLRFDVAASSTSLWVQVKTQQK